MFYKTIIFVSIEAKKTKGKKSLTDEAPPTTNSHATDISMKQMNQAADTDDEAPAGGQSEAEEPAKKDKSVLQAKLTKLAIQIGYAG